MYLLLFSFGLVYQCLNGAITSRHAAKWKNYVYVLTEICHQRSIWLWLVLLNLESNFFLLFQRYSLNAGLNILPIFFSDSNGRQNVKRFRNSRIDYDISNATLEEPVASNYYPINSWISMKGMWHINFWNYNFTKKIIQFFFFYLFFSKIIQAINGWV